MSSINANTNLGISIKAISLLASIALHAAVLVTASNFIGEKGSGPAESSSTLHVIVKQTEPSDDIPRDNPELSQIEQHPEHSEPSQEHIEDNSASTNSSAKQRQERAHKQISLNQPASDKRGAEVAERQPMQVATSGNYARMSRDYKSKLLRLVERHKYYPLQARRNGIEGTSTVAFTVINNGNISGILLARSSGKKLLDQAALQTIKRIGRAPPLPAGRNSWRFTVPMTYDLK